MTHGMSLILAVVLSLSGAAFAFDAPDSPPLFVDSLTGKVYVINRQEKRVDADCLKNRVMELIGEVDANRINPYKVMVSRSHPIVKEMLDGEAVLIFRGADDYSVVLPLKNTAKNVVLFRGESYKYVALEEEIDLSGCLK